MSSQNISSESNDVKAYKDKPSYKEHLGKHRQYWRDIILGVNDGLVSTFLLIAGVSGGGLSVSNILITAISGALAGAISMFAGEYLATKSQNQVLKGEIDLEHSHIRRYPGDELMELPELLTLIGIADVDDNELNRSLRQSLISYYTQNEEALLKIMTALEFGVIEEEGRTPLAAGLFSFFLFILGSLPSVLSFAFVTSVRVGLGIAGGATIFCLFLVGAIKSHYTRSSCLLASIENVLITSAGGGIAYGVGVGFEKLIR